MAAYVYLSRNKTPAGLEIEAVLIADTYDELRRLGRRLELKKRWLKTSSNGVPCYGLTAGQMWQAFRHGAIDATEKPELARPTLQRWWNAKGVVV